MVVVGLPLLRRTDREQMMQQRPVPPRLCFPATPEALGPRSETGRLWLQDSGHNMLGSTDLGLNITSVLNYYYHL